MQPIALPKSLGTFAGRITDIDTHEMMPAQEWVANFGPAMRELAQYFIELGETEEQNLNTPNVPGYPGDILPIDEKIGEIKGMRAPSAVNMPRRVQVMDAMGVERELIYPNAAAFAMTLYKNATDATVMSGFKGDRREQARRCFEASNDWAMNTVSVSERLRPVALLYGDTPEEIISRAKELVRRGIRAMWIYPAGELPGGVSPAHPALDPMWALLAEANCAATLHIAGDGKFFATYGWRDAPAFEGFRHFVELDLDPWFLATLHAPYQNFLTVMLLGGVFDRHPTLRFGVIECGSKWVGPMIEQLDFWYRLNNKMAPDPSAKAYRLPEAPSFYLKRNVRITPFVFEEGLVEYTRQYDLGDVICFSSDYPHVEGGKNALQAFAKMVEPMGPAMMEKFFVSNGQLLLPA